MHKKINIGVVGNGRMAQFHLEVFKNIPNVKVICLSSTRKGSKKRKITANKFNISKSYSCYKRMLIENPNLNAVIIASSLEYNYEIAKFFIINKVSCLVEKPIALDSNNAFQLLQLANKKKVKVFYGLQRRFYSSFVKIKEIQKKNKLNSIFIDAPEHFEMILKKKKFKKKVLKKWVLANGIHCIDLLRYFGGDVKNVISSNISDHGYGNDFNSIIQFKKNIIGIYKSNWKSGGSWTIKLFFNKFYILISPLESSKIYYTNGKTKMIHLSNLDKNYKPGLFEQNLQFIKSLNKKNNDTKYLSDIKDAYKTFQLCCQIAKYST